MGVRKRQRMIDKGGAPGGAGRKEKRLDHREEGSSDVYANPPMDVKKLEKSGRKFGQCSRTRRNFVQSNDPSVFWQDKLQSFTLSPNLSILKSNNRIILNSSTVS